MSTHDPNTEAGAFRLTADRLNLEGRIIQATEALAKAKLKAPALQDRMATLVADAEAGVAACEQALADAEAAHAAAVAEAADIPADLAAAAVAQVVQKNRDRPGSIAYAQLASVTAAN